MQANAISRPMVATSGIEGSAVSAPRLAALARNSVPRAAFLDSCASRSRRIFERRDLREPEHAMIRRVVGASLSTADKTSERRAVDDCAASLLSHLLQLELHAAPDPAQIDRHDTVIIVSPKICSFSENILHTGVVVGNIASTESRHGLRDHCLHLASSDTSHCTARALDPWVLNASTADCTASTFQSASTTTAPNEANAFAVARPNPEPSPVRSATLFSKVMFKTLSSARYGYGRQQ